MRTGLLMIWLIGMGISSAAQLYQTQSGIVQVNGTHMGAKVLATSNHLFIHLNYNKAHMQLRLEVSTLITENDSLNELLRTLSGHVLAFDGKMNIAFIQTKSHPIQKFTTQGMLFFNGTGRPFSFNSLLEHFPRGNATCILSGEFMIDLKQFKIKNLLPGEDKVRIKFSQLVLKKPGE